MAGLNIRRFVESRLGTDDVGKKYFPFTAVSPPPHHYIRPSTSPTLIGIDILQHVVMVRKSHHRGGRGRRRRHVPLQSPPQPPPLSPSPSVVVNDHHPIPPPQQQRRKSTNDPTPHPTQSNHIKKKKKKYYPQKPKMTTTIKCSALELASVIVSAAATASRARSKKRAHALQKFANGQCVTTDMRRQALVSLYAGLRSAVRRRLAAPSTSASAKRELRRAIPRPSSLKAVCKTMERTVFHHLGLVDPHRYMLRVVELRHVMDTDRIRLVALKEDEEAARLATVDQTAIDLSRIIQSELDATAAAQTTELDFDQVVKDILGVQGEAGLQCSKCGAKNVQYRLEQIRSADEGMTPVCECKACGFIERKE